MNDILLSDWTLAAFKQREEERRRREREEAARVTTKEETPRSSEASRPDWTVAALQKRFAALEERLASLEQREEERHREEQAEAAHAPIREERPHSDEMVLRDSTLVAFKQSEDERRSKKEAEFDKTPIGREQVEPPYRLDQPPRRDQVEPERVGGGFESVQREPYASRTIASNDAIYIEPSRGSGRRFFLILITAVIATAIGFGVGLYVVPIEKANHFRAAVKRGLDLLHPSHPPPESQ